ncbi:leucine-rich repeat-containing protein 34-like [Anthonomus grandis grandis]|uniref:leucine-rich repeat-containing protein 34-like n=1 Tax=Anthonomus grandis grandis TaxID=2921223 RepID=UPI00216522EF|nr:leucine-rich repeat-containing protein 34-like [Anthonomus grandis grandis]
MTRKKVDDVFFQLFCEKNSDGTKHLRLRGKELYQRFGFRLDKSHIRKLADFLSSHPEIISLDLSYNNLGNDGAEILADLYFDKPNSIKHLNLLHCDIEPAGLKSLSNAKCLNLKSMKLEGNKLGPEGAQFIGTVIDRCEELETLDIGETDQTNESIEAILIVIEKSSLKSLNISRIIPKTYYSKYNTANMADNISILMKLNESLEVLRVQKCEFDGHDIELLVSGLFYHRNLRMLDLGANRFGDHGIKFIGSWLKIRPPNLIGLRLPGNNITGPGAQILAQNLPFSRIRYLDLQHNKINKKGVSEILYSIKKSTPMRMFFIWGNEIGHEELLTLEKFLKVGILEQECIDVKIYKSDGNLRAAYYPTNEFVLKSYSISDYGFPPELKIIRNEIVAPTEKPRALVNFEFVKRYPPALPKPKLAQHRNSKESDDVSTTSKEEKVSSLLNVQESGIFI